MIKNIQVKNVLGQFDYNIDLSEKIKIIIGPNGSGKITFFKIINSVLTQRHMELYEYEFDEVSIITDSGILKIYKLVNDDPKSDHDSLIEYELDGEKIGSLIDRDLPSLMYFVRHIPKLSRSRDHVFDIETNEVFTSDDKHSLVEKYASYLPKDFYTIPEKAVNYLKNYNVTTIFTDRLHTKSYMRGQSSGDIYFTTSISDSVNQIEKLLSEQTSAYAEYSQKLDQHFPLKIVDVLKKSPRPEVKMTDIQRLSDEVSELRKKLTNTGLFDENKDLTELHLQNADNDMGKETLLVLKEYFMSMKDKLNVILPFSNKIALLLDLFNQKINSSGKTCYIDYKDGFYIRNRNEKKISFEGLSSGEQHEFIQLYTLIFKVDNEDIVLIDEPEISIHVSWQRKFIDDLEKTLHDKKDTRVIIATHSVQIVDDNWDSVIDMGAVEK